MEQKILAFINSIRLSKEQEILNAIAPQTNLREDLDLTSFDLAALTVHIEDEFGIDIFEDGLVHTVGDIYVKLSQ